MSDQVYEIIKENKSTNVQLPAVVPAQENSLTNSKDEALRIAIVSEALADRFVRHEGKYLLVDRRKSKMKVTEAMGIAQRIIRDEFPFEYKDSELVKKILQKVFSDDPDEPNNSIALWDGTIRCAPGIRKRVLRGPLMASINSWVLPSYRQQQAKTADMSMLERFLKWIVVQDQDRDVTLDWLTWNLSDVSANGTV